MTKKGILLFVCAIQVLSIGQSLAQTASTGTGSSVVTSGGKTVSKGSGTIYSHNGKGSTTGGGGGAATYGGGGQSR